MKWRIFEQPLCFKTAVDSGDAPHSMQVGQTGKTVAQAFILVVKFQSNQHLAGMRTSKALQSIVIKTLQF